MAAAQLPDGLRHAQQHPGVNSNLLAGDGRDNIEELSGMSHLSGIIVDIVKSLAASDAVERQR